MYLYHVYRTFIIRSSPYLFISLPLMLNEHFRPISLKAFDQYCIDDAPVNARIIGYRRHVDVNEYVNQSSCR